MPPWILKAAIQGITARVPGSERVNRMIQRVTGALDLDERMLASKLARCRKHLEKHARLGNANPRPAVLELGTGWFPIAPLGFALCGAAPVYCVDVESHLDREQVREALQKIVGYADRLEGVEPERIAAVERAVADRGSVDAMLATAGVTNLVADARTLELGRQVDLIVSNNTLEHIPRGVIEGIFDRFRRLLSPGGVMSHWIDMSDHYMNFDPTIGPYNFLKFSDSMWRLFNNRHQYQNRLRVSDFREIHAATGWDVVEETNTAGRPEELRPIRIAPEFEKYAPSDLLVYETWMVSRTAS